MPVLRRRRARPPPGRKRPRPLQAEKRPRFCGTVSRQREVERIRRAIPLARVCAEATPAAMPVLRRQRASAARSEANAPFASRKNSPAFAGPFCVRGRRRGSGGRSPSPGYAQMQPLRQCRSCADGAPVRCQVGSDHAPCKRKNGPAFAGPYRAKGKPRGSGGRSPSPGYAQKQPLRQWPFHRRRARPPPGWKQTRPLQAEKRPRFCGAVLRQRETERIRRAISLARALDTSCSGVSPR